jgi:hypothetical protein
LIFKGLVHPLGLAVFEDRLYYTDYSLNTIFTVNKRTGQRLGELKNNLRSPTGVNVVHPLHQKQGKAVNDLISFSALYSVRETEQKTEQKKYIDKIYFFSPHTVRQK